MNGRMTTYMLGYNGLIMYKEKEFPSLGTGRWG